MKITQNAAVLFLLAACQPQAATKMPATVAAAPVVLAAPAAAPALPDSAAAVQALLRTVDLSPAWANTLGTQPPKPMDGFYGPDHYHIAFFFDSVRRDSHQPAVFHIWGRDRYKHVTTPFTGTCTVTRLAPLPDTVSLERSQDLRPQTAFADFVLREDPVTKGAGVYRGRAALDFGLDAHGRLALLSFMDMDAGEGNPTQGCGLVFRGEWQDNKSGRRKPVAWAAWYGVIVPDAFRQLGLGGRGEEVNPELAKYGWGENWENDEWWADSPKPSLSL